METTVRLFKKYEGNMHYSVASFRGGMAYLRFKLKWRLLTNGKLFNIFFFLNHSVYYKLKNTTKN